MARIVIELSDKDMEAINCWAKANGFASGEAWLDELFRQHLAQEFLAATWRFEDEPDDDWLDNLVTDPGGGVWHEDDYPGE